MIILIGELFSISPLILIFIDLSLLDNPFQLLDYFLFEAMTVIHLFWIQVHLKVKTGLLFHFHFPQRS
jgi:hypothetical protein